MTCRYCFKLGEEDMPLIDVKAYSAGKIEWQYLGNVCKTCRKYLKGLWRYHKEKWNEKENSRYWTITGHT